MASKLTYKRTEIINCSGKYVVITRILFPLIKQTILKKNYFDVFNYQTGVYKGEFETDNAEEIYLSDNSDNADWIHEMVVKKWKNN